NRLLEDVGMLRDAVGGQAVEAHATRLHPLVVARRAVLFDGRQRGIPVRLKADTTCLRDATCLRDTTCLRVECHAAESKQKRAGDERLLQHLYASGDRYPHWLSNARRTNSSGLPIFPSNSFVGFASTASPGLLP